MPPARSPLSGWARGHRAEALAALVLRLKGYRILARGERAGKGSGAGEIDIVALKGRTLVFVEVKARVSAQAALNAVSSAQRRRLERGAEAFLARNPSLRGLAMRFDAVAVMPRRWPLHLIDAWRQGD